MNDDFEAQFRRQSELDAYIESAISRSRKRRRMLVVGLSLCLFIAICVLLKVVINRVFSLVAAADHIYVAALKSRQTGNLNGVVLDLRRVLVLKPDYADASLDAWNYL